MRGVSIQRARRPTPVGRASLLRDLRLDSDACLILLACDEAVLTV